MATWIAQEATGRPTAKTQGLVERIRAQSEGIDGAIVTFWAEIVQQRAVRIEACEPTVRVMMLDISTDLARKVCSTLRTVRKIPCCVVRGASRIGIVLGVAEPPEKLDEWIIVHIEGRNPHNCV